MVAVKGVIYVIFLPQQSATVEPGVSAYATTLFDKNYRVWYLSRILRAILRSATGAAMRRSVFRAASPLP